jgi:hypothetical protein
VTIAETASENLPMPAIIRSVITRYLERLQLRPTRPEERTRNWSRPAPNQRQALATGCPETCGDSSKRPLPSLWGWR